MDIFYAFLVVVTIEVLHFMQDAVDERHDAHGQRNLGTLLEMAPLVLLDAQTGFGYLFVLLLQQVVQRVVNALLAVQMVEQPKQEQQ